MPIRQITIVGTGLIGGSFALAIRKQRFSGRIVGCDRAPVLERARHIGVIDEGHANPSDAVRGSQVVVLAAPVGAIIDLIKTLGPVLPAKTLLTDVGSTKTEIVSQAGKIFGRAARNRFLAGHPMAGREQSGVEHAHADLFQGAAWFFTPFPGQTLRRASAASSSNGWKRSVRRWAGSIRCNTTGFAPGSATCPR